MAAEGQTDKEIAGNLGLSLKTIHTYWDRMRQKFDSSTRTQVFAKFLRIELSRGNSPERFHYLFSSWGEGVWVVAPPNTTIYANRRVAEIFGYTEEAFQALPSDKILEGARAPELAELIRDAGPAAASVEALIRTSANGNVWVQVTTTPLMDGAAGQRSVVLRVLNISPQKGLEQTLRSSEANVRRIVEISSDSVCRFDGDLTCRYVNPSFLNLMGCAAEKVMDRRIEDLAGVLGTAEPWRMGLQQAMRTGEEYSFDQTISGRGKFRVYLLPEPSPDFQPTSIIALMRSSA
jgi:PAS domain S-box-containing protein